MKNRAALSKLFYSIFIFVTVFLILGFAVDKIWFREDDLGTILNGLIYNLRDFVRVFSTDCRSFITTVNYTRTAPNFISGFLRPMQNVFFSLVHWWCGTNANAYFLVHVALHAINATLFFALSSLFMPSLLACAASLLVALYPDVSWLMWIATVQNSLTLFFILLAALSFYRYWRIGLYRWYIVSGLMFLLSIFSRENTIFLPFWVFVGALCFPALFTPAGCLSAHVGGWLSAIKNAFVKTWIFFAGFAFYAFVRVLAFGFDTLPRTLNRLLLLAQQTRMAPAYLTNAKTSVAPPTVFSAHASQHFFQSILDAIWWLCSFLQNQTRAWCEVFLKFSPRTFLLWLAFIALSIFLVSFLLYAYREKRKELLWLFFGMFLLAWPGVVTYPNARYLNVVFPLFVFVIAYGAYLLFKQKNIVWKNVTLSLVTMAGIALGFVGIQENRKNLYNTGLERYNYKARFDAFFSAYDVSEVKRFVFLSSPFISDIQNVFRAYTNRNVDVVADPFTTLAERGCMGCRESYRTVGVASSVELDGNAFRLRAIDKEFCGWWLRHSDLPVVWDGKQRVYSWSSNQYRQGQWYACSIGKFRINQLANGDCASDMSFVIDKKWIDRHTAFVAWDSMHGRYYVVAPHRLS